MSEESITNVLLVAYIVEALLAAWAFYRIRRIYIEEQGWKSLLFRALVTMSGISVAVGLFLVPVGVITLFHLPELPFTSAGIIAAVMVLLGAVIFYWIVFERIRAGRHLVKRADRTYTEQSHTGEGHPDREAPWP